MWKGKNVAFKSSRSWLGLFLLYVDIKKKLNKIKDSYLRIFIYFLVNKKESCLCDNKNFNFFGKVSLQYF